MFVLLSQDTKQIYFGTQQLISEILGQIKIKASLRSATAYITGYGHSGIVWQLLVSFKGIIVAEFVGWSLSLPNSYYWNTNFLTLGEALRLSNQVKKKMNA